MAWLRATPKGAKESRLKEHGEKLPPIDDCEHIDGYLSDLNYCERGEMGGLKPVSRTEIECYLRNLLGVCEHWLLQLLYDLSLEYAIQGNKSVQPDCIAPYLFDTEDSETMTTVRENADKKLRNIF